MKTTDANYKEIMNVVNKHNRVINRENELMEMGYCVAERRMGSGGVGQIKNLKNEIRIQIGYGHTGNNYASCIIIKK